MLTCDPEFLAGWVQAELEALGEPEALSARAKQLAADAGDALDEDEARSEAASVLADRRGFLHQLRTASDELGALEVREARGGTERLERNEPRLFAGPPACTAWLRAAPGAARRLSLLVERLLADPSLRVAELEGPLGGTPGCSTR